MTDNEKASERSLSIDARNLYLEAHDVKDIRDPYESYQKLSNAIAIGLALVSDPNLKKEAEVLIVECEKLMQITDMELQDDQTYSIGTGKFGCIRVMSQDLEAGVRHYLMQQACVMIPKLRILDMKIMDNLVRTKVIPKKSFSIDDILFEVFDG